MTGVALEKYGGGAAYAKQSLRLWLRMYSCVAHAEKQIRYRLARDFGTTLPRFDVLAALDRCPEGMTMGALSERLLVSNGNVTGLVARLVDDGLVAREIVANDRRATSVTLTLKGRKEFARMAAAHEAWIESMFASLKPVEIRTLLDGLSRAAASIAQAEDRH